jgi:hypothetical protein
MLLFPYQHPGRWYQGGLHCHSTNSDGGHTPAEVAEFYRSRGYDFFALTDHGRLTRTDEFSTRRFLCLPAEELSNPHLVALGIRRLIRDQLGFQDQINAVRRHGGLPILAHPAWMGLRVHDIVRRRGLVGIEIYNYICETLNAKGYALNIWDELLERGCRLWGFAVDDAHLSVAHPGGDAGWIVVRAPELSQQAILRSITDGCFYSSTGPVIKDIVLEQDGPAYDLSVRCSPCESITFIGAAHVGRRYTRPRGGLLTRATYRLRPDMRYCRIECRAPDGTVAWTNPVFLE